MYNMIKALDGFTWDFVLNNPEIANILGANLTYTYAYGDGSDRAYDICLGRCLNPENGSLSLSSEYDYDILVLGEDLTDRGRWNSETRDYGFRGADGTWYDTPMGALLTCKYALFKYDSATDRDILVKASDKIDANGDYVWDSVCVDVNMLS